MARAAQPVERLVPIRIRGAWRVTAMAMMVNPADLMKTGFLIAKTTTHASSMKTRHQLQTTRRGPVASMGPRQQAEQAAMAGREP